MTPSSDKNSSSDSRNNRELLKAIGNPAATEEEWLSACEKLGDYQQPKSRKKNIPLLVGQSALALAVLTALVYSGITLFSLNNSKPPVPAPVAQAPVPAAGDIDYGPYMSDLQRRIKRAWFPPRGNGTKRVQVRFKVHSNGTMDSLKIYKSSGVPVADAAALKAVENAVPFKALPSAAPENVDIEFTFDYNVFAGNKKL
jgi:TonB family protein